MPFAAMRLRAGAGPSSYHTPALDSYTSNLWAAHSLKRELTAYTGALIRVRDTTTTTEYDIGYDGNNVLDVATLLLNIGANSATVVKFYDQSGNGNDLSQTGATGKQPRIVNAGVFDGFARFDGTDDCMQTPNLPGSNTGMTFLLYGNIRSHTGSFNIWLESTANSVSYAGIGVFHDSANSRLDITSGAPSSANFIFANHTTQNPANDVTAYVGDRTASGAANISKYYKAGVLLTPTGSSAGTNTGNYAAAPVNLGARNNGESWPTQLDAKALVIYTAVVNGTDIAALSLALVE